MAVQLVTRTQVKTALHTINESGQSDNDLIDMLIEDVAGLAEDYCDRWLTYAERTENYDGGTKEIRLKGYKVWAVAHIKDGTTEAPGASDITSATRYDADTGVVRYIDGKFTKGWLNVEAKYTAGYDENQANYKPTRGLHLAILNEVIAQYHLHMDEPLPAEGVDPFARVTALTERGNKALVPFKRIIY